MQDIMPDPNQPYDFYKGLEAYRTGKGAGYQGPKVVGFIFDVPMNRISAISGQAGIMQMGLPYSENASAEMIKSCQIAIKFIESVPTEFIPEAEKELILKEINLVLEASRKLTEANYQADAKNIAEASSKANETILGILREVLKDVKDPE